MLSFDHYLNRHGEPAVQAIIERLERQERAAGPHIATLEERWNALMQDYSKTRQAT